MSRLTPPDTELEDCSDLINELEKSIKKKRMEIRGIELEINRYESTIKGGIECPKCEHVFTLTSDLSIKDCKKAIPLAEKRLVKAKQELKNIKRDFNLLEESQEKFEEYKTNERKF